MSSVIAKLACYGSTLMDEADLKWYFSFLQDQLKNQQVRRSLYFINLRYGQPRKFYQPCTKSKRMFVTLPQMF